MAEIKISGDILTIISDIEQYWTRKKGLFLVFVLEFILLAYIWGRKGFPSLLAAGITALALFFITAIVWFITSKRILFRSWGLVLLWLSLAALVMAFFYFIAYSKWIQYHDLDLPYIRMWGSVVVFFIIVLIGLIVDCFLLKGKKLIIVFAVNNESIAVEKTIRASIDPVVQKIQDADSNLRLVVLPFGVIKSVRRSERYIRRPLTRADAIIFASVVDDSSNTPVSYIFTDFSSRINEKRFVREELKGSIDRTVLETHFRYHDWNFINQKNDACSRKVEISKNLEEMLKLYIGCMYVMKHNFDAAVTYADNAICTAPRNSQLYSIASSLFSYSLLSSARSLENEEHEYDAAFELLMKLNKAMPVTSQDPGYNKAMARVMFYKNDIKASESYTRKFKNLPNHRWGFELNMGFYAINKKKVLEFVQHYKNLRRYSPCEKTEVDFAIGFLEYQEKKTSDKHYSVLLKIAIAFLTLYKNPVKAHKQIGKIDYSSDNERFNKAVSDLRGIILSTNKRLEVVPSKKKN